MGILELTIASNLRGTPGNETRVVQKIDDSVRQLQRVEQLASKTANGDRDLENLQQSAGELLAIFYRSRQSQYAPELRHVMQGNFYRETKQHFKSSAIALNNIISKEESIYAGNSSIVHTFRSDVKVLFVVSAVAGALGAIVLGYVFAMMISKPIKHISANVRLISLRKKLNPTLNTGDEFAALDQVLHDVADSIEHASISARALIDNAQDLICSFKDDGTFVSANAYAGVMLGFAPDELIGRQLAEILPPEDNPLAQHEFEATRLGSKQRSFELRMRKKDDSFIDTRWSCFWSSTDDSLFSVINDITEQRRNERLKQEFVEMIKQELQVPLTAMAGSLRIISESVNEAVSADVTRRVQSMLRNIERLIVLVNALLGSQTFTTPRMELKLEDCDMQLLVDEAVDMVRSLADAKKLELEVSPVNCKVVCDKQKLREVLVNLLGNAIKFTPPRSKISISFQEHLDQIEVKITDQGPGVPAEYRESIFRDFEQAPEAKEFRQGVGLGLAICKLIVDAHGGSIGVTSTAADANFDRSKQSTGSTFWFRIAAASISP